MAHQHVFLVQDKAFEFACLKDRSKAQQGGQVEVGDRLLAKIVDFAHPRTGTMRTVTARVQIQEKLVVTPRVLFVAYAERHVRCSAMLEHLHVFAE